MDVAVDIRMRSYQIELDGTRIPVYESGRGDALLLLHGYMGSHLSWRHQFDALSRFFRVVAVDWPGWGDSEKNSALDYSLETEVERLRRLIQMLDLGPVHLAGQDYGGLLTLGYAQKYPDDVLDIIVMNCKSHGTWRPQWFAVFELMHLLARLPGSKQLYRALPLKSMHRLMTRKAVRQGIMTSDVVEHYCGWMKSASGGAYLAKFFENYQVGSREDIARGLPQMRTDALILWGARDRYLNVDIAHDLARSIPNAQLKIYPEAGHFLAEEEPDGVLQDMLGFLQRGRGRVRVYGQRPASEMIRAPERFSGGGRTPGR